MVFSNCTFLSPAPLARAVCLAAFLLIMATVSRWGLQLLDDGYYYMQIAWNISRGCGSSFDGIHLTNGYHPLWQFFIVPVFWVCSKAAAAWIVVGLQALLFTGSGYVLFRLVHRTAGAERAKWMGAVACAVWVLNTWLWSKGALSGMETGLLLLLFGISLDALVGCVRTGEGGWRLGILMALTCAARLDSIALALSAAVVLLLLGMRRRALETLAPSVGYLVLYVTFNLILFGGGTPVSGWVKSAEGRGLLVRLIRDGDTTVLSHTLGNLQELFTLGGRIPLPASILLLALCVAGSVLAYRRSGRELRALILAMTGYGVLLIGFYSVMYPSLLGAYTYYWLPLIFGITAIASVFASGFGKLPRMVAASAAVALLLLFNVVYVADRLGSYSFCVAPEDRPDALGVSYLNSIEGDVLVGSWDAGYLGYECRHPVVNLDGLVAGYDYQRFLDEHGLEEWIRREGITHLANVDYWSGKREFIQNRLGWTLVFADTTAMPRPVSLFSMSSSDLEYASHQLRIFYVYARPDAADVYARPDAADGLDPGRAAQNGS
jgi:hypothetical protein